jgi:hypothetical protein
MCTLGGVSLSSISTWGGALPSICVSVAHPRRLLLILRVRAFVRRRPDRMVRPVAGLVVHYLIVWLPDFLRLVMM